MKARVQLRNPGTRTLLVSVGKPLNISKANQMGNTSVTSPTIIQRTRSLIYISQAVIPRTEIQVDSPRYRNDILTAFNEGAGFVDFEGHGWPGGWDTIWFDGTIQRIGRVVSTSINILYSRMAICYQSSSLVGATMLCIMFR